MTIQMTVRHLDRIRPMMYVMRIERMGVHRGSVRIQVPVT